MAMAISPVCYMCTLLVVYILAELVQRVKLNHRLNCVWRVAGLLKGQNLNPKIHLLYPSSPYSPDFCTR